MLENRENLIKKKKKEYEEMRIIYDSLLKCPQKNMNQSEINTYKQINVDIPRTMPEYKLFSFCRIREMMMRILFTWSMRHPASGYVQGFNDLCTPFLIIFINKYINFDLDYLDIEEETLLSLGDEILFDIEADSYWSFTKMMDRIQNNYTNNQPGITIMMKKTEDIIKLVDKDLSNFLDNNDVKFMQFTFRWMNCYLMREFSVKLIIRLFDAYFSEDNAFNNFHLFVCASLLLNFSEKIKKMNDFQEIILFLQNLPVDKWTISEIDILLAKAYQISTLYGKTLKDK